MDLNFSEFFWVPTLSYLPLLQERSAVVIIAPASLSAIQLEKGLKTKSTVLIAILIYSFHKLCLTNQQALTNHKSN